MDTSIPEGVLLRNVPFLSAFNGCYEHKCISCFLFFLFHLLLLLILSVISNISATYRSLHVSQRIYWNLAGVRSVFGVSSVVLSIVTLIGDKELRDDTVLGVTLSCQFFFTYIVGFFIFECCLLLFTEITFGVKSLGLLAHHFISLIGYSIGLFWDHGYFIGALVVSLEMSTPFSCLCWVLLKMKLSQSLLWFANQWILVHLFHTRQNVLCVVMLVVARDWENVWQNMNVLLTVLLVGGAVIMLGGLNPYWTQKKTEQLFTREDWNFHSVIPQINNNNNKSTNQCNGSLTT
eukprot:TRINITY_DN1243_c0_g1_i4.p1 TRINITY_DN1243_c0_g1~~TRINITY_DN1243_c0_g1_i4.p1  ORF type:complete len:291 (-),score=45.97 TRINITY_DN1243_c0_g1_i4:6-878(-)